MQTPEEITIGSPRAGKSTEIQVSLPIVPATVRPLALVQAVKARRRFKKLHQQSKAKFTL